MNKTLTKAKLADSLSEKIGFNHVESRELVDALLRELIKSLVNGEDVRLWQFGNFVLLDKPARPGRNPRTREETMISPRRVVTFRPGQKLRLKVSRND